MNKFSISVFICIIISSTQLVGQKYESPIYQIKGIAIDGYDAVAYFSESKSVKGIEQFSTTWKNVIWQFSSAENLEEFMKAPEKYVPQYGGYCAYGMSNGYKAKVDPKDSWTIVDDKLYINYNIEVKNLWLPKKESLIKKADENWKQFKD